MYKIDYETFTNILIKVRGILFLIFLCILGITFLLLFLKMYQYVFYVFQTSLLCVGGIFATGLIDYFVYNSFRNEEDEWTE